MAVESLFGQGRSDFWVTPNPCLMTLIKSKCSLVDKKMCGYRVTHLVANLGWVGCEGENLTVSIVNDPPK